MPNLQDDKPLQSGFTQQLSPSSDGHESDEATFQFPEDDPGQIDNRGGLEAVIRDEQSGGKLDNNDSTTGLIAPAAQPGGHVGAVDSRTGTPEPKVEMSSNGVVDASVTDLGDANDRPLDANDDETGP